MAPLPRLPHCPTCACTPPGRTPCPLCGRVLKTRVDGRRPIHRLREFGVLTNQTCDGSFTLVDQLPAPNQEDK